MIASRPGFNQREGTVVITLADSIMISRSPGDVFAFVADLSNIPLWQSEVVTSKVMTPGPTKVGTRFTEDVRMGPTRTTATCEVTEFAPGALMGFKAMSPRMDYMGRMTVEGVTGGTKLTMEGSAQMKGWWRLMQPLMRSEAKSGIRKELEAVKAALEGDRRR